MRKLLVLALMTVILLSMTSAFADTGKTLTMWCIATESDANRPAYINAIATVEERLGVKIEWKAFENSYYKNRIKSAMQNPSTLPDIFFTWAGAFCSDFVAEGKVYCLDNTYDNYADQLPAVMLENVSYGEEQKPYAVPMAMNAVVLFVNMDLLAEAGWSRIPETYKDLIACCDDLVAAGITPFGCAGSETWCVTEYLEPMLEKSIGHEALKSIFAGESTWNDPAIAKTVDAFQDMIQKGYFGSYDQPDDEDYRPYGNDQVRVSFINGKTAFYQNGSWNCREISYAGDNFKVALFPVIDSEKATYNQIIGGPSDSLAVSAYSDDPELAATVAFELGKEICHYSYLAGAGLPAWTPDYDTSSINSLTADAAALVAASDGTVLFGDSAMDSYSAISYLDYVSQLFNYGLSGTEFVENLSGEPLNGTVGGQCGENATWLLDYEGTLTISGSGDMEDFDENPTENWHSNPCWQVETIIVNEGITGIGNYAFAYCRSVASITMPESVTHIGAGAFRDTKIPGINLLRNVVSIGPYAFSNCDCLESIAFPQNLETIGEQAFSGCNSLTEITVTGAKSIGAGAFSNCSGLNRILVASANDFYISEDGVLFTKDMSTLVQYPAGRGVSEYTVPRNVIYIGGSAFAGDETITDITILEGVVDINERAFQKCPQLKTVLLPKSLQSIGSLAFCDSGLETIYFCGKKTDRNKIDIGSSNIPLINADWHYLAEEGPKKNCLILPKSLRRIEEGAFSDVKAIIVYIPDSVEYIDEAAFAESNITMIFGNTDYIENYAEENGYYFVPYDNNK